MQSEVDDFYQLILEAREAQRGYLLSGNKQSLSVYQNALPRIPPALEKLKRVVVDSERQDANTKGLDTLVGQILEELKIAVVLRDANNSPATLAIAQTGQGEELMAQLRQVLTRIDNAAKAQASFHERFYKRHVSEVLWAITGGAVIGLLLITSFAYLVSIEIRRRSKVEAELRTAQDAALIASKMKSRFLANVSHEVRTPLNGIIGMSDLLLMRSKDQESRRFAEVIHDSGQTLLKIVNEILDFSKIEAGRIEFEFSEFSLRELVGLTAELYSVKAQEKSLLLQTHFDDDLPEVVIGDSTRVAQVLRNLVSNSIKFTERGSVTVNVKLRFQAGSKAVIRFEVRDTGAGFPEDQKAHLFKPFNQLNNINGVKEPGTGLGLSISKELVERMGGLIDVSSSLDQGSNFWFEIPFKVSEQPIEFLKRKKEDSTFQHSGELAPQRLDLYQQNELPLILVADDNSTNRIFAEALVKELGYRVHVVANGSEVLEVLERIPYDLILMDCQMPVMDGYEATRLIRTKEIAKGIHLPIIALTANATSEAREKCLMAGMDDFLSKPFERSDIAKILERWLNVRTKAIVDWSKLKDLESKTNASVVSKMKTSFIQTLSKCLDDLDDKNGSRSRLLLKRWAHHLRSSCAILGATALQSFCEELERRCEVMEEQEDTSPLSAEFIQAIQKTMNSYIENVPENEKMA